MEEKKILYVSSEVVPYLAENEISLASYDVPKMVNDNGGQIRIFMPRYGNINERRHQLHEVIRLSGMNLVVNDVDMQSEEHTSELQSRENLVCRLLLEKKKKKNNSTLRLDT